MYGLIEELKRPDEVARSEGFHTGAKQVCHNRRLAARRHIVAHISRPWPSLAESGQYALTQPAEES
jgi:hypothetical protein